VHFEIIGKDPEKIEAAGSFKRKEPPEIRGTGYVVESLEAALWAFARPSSFWEGALLAVNLGDDADTTGAIYGQSPVRFTRPNRSQQSGH
jgi:ADP-ribosylglycohydrolase